MNYKVYTVEELDTLPDFTIIGVPAPDGLGMDGAFIAAQKESGAWIHVGGVGFIESEEFPVTAFPCIVLWRP